MLYKLQNRGNYIYINISSTTFPASQPSRASPIDGQSAVVVRVDEWVQFQIRGYITHSREEGEEEKEAGDGGGAGNVGSL